MDTAIIEQVAKILPYKKIQIQHVMALFEEGNTIPFIARYRKEKTGGLDEVALKEISQAYQQEEELRQRKETVIHAIETQGQLSQSLRQAIVTATTKNEVEELYRPYKQKRKTRATKAREAGLTCVALAIYENKEGLQTLVKERCDKSYPNEEDVLQGAIDIIAEEMSNDNDLRVWMKKNYYQYATWTSKKKKKAEDDKHVYQQYYDFSSSLNRLVSHRILACNRGEKEKVLTVSIHNDKEKLASYMKRRYIKKHYQKLHLTLLHQAIDEALTRFLMPAMERECRSELTAQAEQQAIQVFGNNLRQLLLQSPLKEKTIMGFDPAYRTGCKLAIVNPLGELLAVDIIYPFANEEKAKSQLLQLIEHYHVDIIAIGNGTASRESERFVSYTIKNHPNVSYTIVSEAGASVYSASDIAREEFPDLPVEKRSAISIARRIQDPLAELIKIDPQSVGVGQYQHDVNQKQLAQQLDFVVDTAVNQVGVNVNTASQSLLTHIAGLSQSTAANIVAYRQDNGPFTSREQLKQVKRLGQKTYEQAVGFLRLPNSTNPFDNTDIHPESYPLAEKLLVTLQLKDMRDIDDVTLSDKDMKTIAEQLCTTPLMINELIAAMKRRGRDLRDAMPQPLLRQDVLTLSDLKEGMELQGTVRNVVDFGAFVDIGVKEDGLVHLSKITKQYIHHPSDCLAVGDIVTVWVEHIDEATGRISLTMIKDK